MSVQNLPLPIKKQKWRIWGATFIAIAACFLSAPFAFADSTNSNNALERGRMIAIEADCAACHTNPAQRDKPFAGGYVIQSPLGNIVSSNITPSKSFGIGNYSEADFFNALRNGKRKDGSYLYPAMPYDVYQRMSDDDIKALYNYFQNGVKAVDDAPSETTNLPFPLNMRQLMLVWNGIYARNGVFIPDESKSESYNRGAYLVEVMGHCGTCHTPRDLLMGNDSSRALAGGQLGSWYAPNITPDKATGIGTWSKDDIVNYLKNGHVAGKAQAAGPMAEAVENSFRYMKDSDLTAIADYLVAQPAHINEDDKKLPPLQAATQNYEVTLRGQNLQTANNTVKTGEALYSGNCASCHQPDGKGTANQAYPALIDNSAVNRQNPNNLVAAILYGVARKGADRDAIMPAFSGNSAIAILSDEDIAKVANYVRVNFGNSDFAKANNQISANDVAIIRNGGPKTFLAKILPYAIPLMILGGLIVLAIIILIIRKVMKKRKIAKT